MHRACNIAIAEQNNRRHRGLSWDPETYSRSKSTHPNPAGGGIGGAAAAYFVRQLCGDSVGIHVFEGQHVGGRLRSMSFEQSTYEMGGSMVYEDNIYIRCPKMALPLPCCGQLCVCTGCARCEGSNLAENV